MKQILPKKYTKSARIAAKKVSDKYKKIGTKRNIDTVAEIKNAASKKSAQITAKKKKIEQVLKNEI